MKLLNNFEKLSTDLKTKFSNTYTATLSGSNLTTNKTFTLQDRSGTLADDTDLALKAPIASPTFTGMVTLAAGTTTVGPIKMISGTNLTTPVAGVFEFDGTNLYFSV